MKSNYLIIKDRKLIIETFSGILTLENAQKHKMEMSKDPEYSSEYEVISDLSKAIFDMPVSMTGELQNDSFNKNAKSGALVHKANQPVYERIFNRLRLVFPPSHLYSINLDDLLHWMGINDLKEEIESSLLKLHQNPQFDWV